MRTSERARATRGGSTRTSETNELEEEPNNDVDHVILVWSSTAADNPLHPHLYQNAIRMTSRYRLAYHEAVWELCSDGRGSAWIIPVRDLP